MKPGCGRNGGGASIGRCLLAAGTAPADSALEPSARFASRRQSAPSRLAARKDSASNGSPAKLTESARPTVTATAVNANRGIATSRLRPA